MSNDTTQPTILVKKSDGTSVRMTMDELQAYKKSASAPLAASAPVKTEANSAPVKPVVSLKEIKQELPKTLHQKSMEEKPAPQKLKASFVRPTPPVEEKMFTEKWEDSDNASLLDDSLKLKEKLPAVKATAANMPATSTPVKNIFVDEAKYKLKFEKPKVEVKSVIQPKQPAYASLSASAPQMKQIIQDVRPPQIAKQSVGPVDELENFSLEDFRRLEINAKAASLKLIDKFETLKHDSYLLFLDGVKAWYNSPLYKQYQDAFYQSFVNNKSVNEILTSGNKQKDLKLEEFKAILSVNEAIN